MIQATPGRNVSGLVDVIEDWVRSGVAIVYYRGVTISLVEEAVVRIGLEEGICIPEDDTPILTTTDGRTDDATTESMTTNGATITHSLCYACIILTLVLLINSLGH